MAQDSSLRSAWLAELKECDERKTSLIRQMKRARRAGDSRKFADLDKQYWEMFPPMFRPRENPANPWPEQRYIWMDSKTYGNLEGLLSADNEWDKTIPRRLRNEKGRRAWETLLSWRAASEDEKRSLKDMLFRLRLKAVRLRRYSSTNAVSAFENIFRHLESKDRKFFSMFEVALQEEGNRGNEKLRSDLIAYRFSLNHSRTPGQRRHTPAQIKQIVAPGSTITPEVFRNMISELEVPHFPDKRGKGSPNYGKRTR
jgi:hypothetical protein